MTDDEKRTLCEKFRSALEEQNDGSKAATYLDGLREQLDPEEFATVRQSLIATWMAWRGQCILKSVLEP